MLAALLISEPQRGATMSTNVVQMNIRLDAQVKERADKVITQAGYTTTQFLRLLWDILARPESNEATVRYLLAAANSSDSSKAQANNQKAREGAQFIQQALKKQGIKVASLPSEEEQATFKSSIMSERYVECDL